MTESVLPTQPEAQSTVAKINRRSWIALGVAIFVIVAGGAPFDQIPEFIGKAIGAALMFVVIGGVMYAFCSPVGQARTRFWTLLVFSIYCATFPLKEIARRAPDNALSDRAVAAFDRGVGASDAPAPLSTGTAPNPMSEKEVIVSLMEALATRTSNRQSQYLAMLSRLDLDAAIARSRLASADGRADARSRLAQFNQAIAEFASSQDEDMTWVAQQLAAWSVAPEMSAKIVAGISRGRDTNLPRLERWLDIQRERVAVMTMLVDLREKQSVGDSEDSLRDRLVTLTADEQELGRAQTANNEQARERLSP